LNQLCDLDKFSAESYLLIIFGLATTYITEIEEIEELSVIFRFEAKK
jgi:hypothetical protein